MGIDVLTGPPYAAGGAPWPNGEPGPGDHLRKVFYRMGFNDQEIVALSGKYRVSSSQACLGDLPDC